MPPAWPDPCMSASGLQASGGDSSLTGGASPHPHTPIALWLVPHSGMELAPHSVATSPCPSEKTNYLPTLDGKVLARLVGDYKSRAAFQSNLDILLGFRSLPQTKCQVGIGLGQELLQKSE